LARAEKGHFHFAFPRVMTLLGITTHNERASFVFHKIPDIIPIKRSFKCRE
jgi:hypothetical protein